MRRCIASIVAVVLSAACGGGSSSSSPTAPTPSASATRIIALSGSLAFGDVVVGQSREATVTITNSGTGAMSLTGITATGGLTAQAVASPTSGTIAAGGSLAVLFRFTPTTTGAFSGTVTFTTDHTSGTNTTTLTGTGVGAPVTVTGVVTNANTRAAVGGVTVRIGSSTTTTDGNGFYSMVVTSATAHSVSYSAANYNTTTATVTFTGDTRRDATLNPFWTASGVGNTVFDMPTYVTRVRIVGTYAARGSNFIVRVGGRLVVNEIIGTGQTGGSRSDGVYAVTGGTVEITNSRDVEWTFTQVQ